MVVNIDLPADLHMEDDDGNFLARLSDAVSPDKVRPGAVMVAGSEHWWTPAVVLEVSSDGWVHLSSTDASIARRVKEADYGAALLRDGITTVGLDESGRLVEYRPDGSSSHVIES